VSKSARWSACGSSACPNNSAQFQFTILDTKFARDTPEGALGACNKRRRFLRATYLSVRLHRLIRFRAKFYIISSRRRQTFCWQAATIPNRPPCGQRKICNEKICEAPFEATTNIGCGNIVPAHAHASPHARDRLIGSGEPKIMKLDRVADRECALAIQVEKLTILICLRRSNSARNHFFGGSSRMNDQETSAVWPWS
jgi:hypothetical protein